MESVGREERGEQSTVAGRVFAFSTEVTENR